MKRILFIIIFSFTAFLKMNAASGDSIWSVNFIHDVYLTFAQNDYYDSLVNTHVTDTYMQASMTLDGRNMGFVGVKFKGNSSYNNSSHKKSLKIDFNYYDTTQDFNGIKKINLNNGFKDPSFLREKLALDFANARGLVAPRCTYARVFFNGLYWGLYDLVEEVDSKFLKQHFPDNNGNLYKGDPNGDMKWYGSSASSYYSHYELNSSSTIIDWSDLVHLLDIGNNTAANVYYDSLETVLDSWQFLEYLAIQNMFVNLDSYAGSGHNYYIFDDSTYFHFHMIEWDVNESFGNFNQTMMTTAQIENLAYDYLNTPTQRPLANNMFSNATYHGMYISCFCNMMPYFNNAYFDPKIDSLVNLIRADVYADSLKFFTDQQFEDNITMNVGPTIGIKPFITARNASLTSQLSAYGCWLGVNDAPATASSSLSIFPNPTSGSTSIFLPNDWKTENCSVKIFDLTGKQVESSTEILSDNSGFSISTSELSNGIYFVTVSDSSGKTASSKLSVLH